ncbi:MULTISPECIES: hypothetical protein [Acidianus]|uniref:Uncharacterized protein n=1 Tax=Candidatus Acidianus copahuensis TaxID=1160895 RepID=A0A031LP59_9CREN|nr:MULTISPECIES: hypothetical protein [Acidianus]EZQ06791.1 hypothetical protein CM19_05295 [Candidatus Acidianus copahuensis]NON61801.1 hypothetical protein [Acidianus sp. RZ1]
MDVNVLLDSEIPGIREALEYGLAEAQFLGKEMIGLSFSNGDGIILYINPFSEQIHKLLFISFSQRNNGFLSPLGIFKYEGGNTIFIYEITNLAELLKSEVNTRVESVEVIKGVLEDFLFEAMDR